MEHISNARITVNGKELPIIEGKVTYEIPTPERTSAEWNAAIKRLYTQKTTITWTINPDNQPTGPIVEGSIEPYE